MHTDCIISNNKKNADFFLRNVNSSIAMHNVSTQFADGGNSVWRRNWDFN